MEDSSTKTQQERACCDGGSENTQTTDTQRWAAVGSVLAAFGVCASCCLLPFSLAALGIGGTWIGQLGVLTAYKPIFVTVAAALLGYGFYAVYWKSKRACDTGADCTSGRTDHRHARLVLWAAAVVVASSVAFDYLELFLR